MIFVYFKVEKLRLSLIIYYFIYKEIKKFKKLFIYYFDFLGGFFESKYFLLWDFKGIC